DSRSACFLIFPHHRDTIAAMPWRLTILAMVGLCALCCAAARARGKGLGPLPGTGRTPAGKKTAAEHNNKPLKPTEELQKAIADAGNDRTALVKSLKSFLEKYPEAPQRPQIYRALVEACLQFKDDSCAADYAERIVALTPDDTSMTLLAVQLLERSGDN